MEKIKQKIWRITLTLIASATILYGVTEIDKSLDLVYAKKELDKIIAEYDLTPEQAQQYLQSALDEFKATRSSIFMPFQKHNNTDKLTTVTVGLDKKLAERTTSE